MLKKAFYIYLFIFALTTISYGNSSFLTDDVPRDNIGYKALDWFIINNKTPEILSYNRTKTLSSYRFTMLLVEIINKTKDFPKKIPDDILNILEDLIPEFSTQIEFMYGNILEQLKNRLALHRQKTGRIKRKNIVLKRKKIGIYNKPRQLFKTKDSSLSSTFSWKLQKETWEGLNSKEEYNNLHLNIGTMFKLRNTPLKFNYYANDLFSTANTILTLKNTSSKKSQINYIRYEDEEKGKNSFSIFKTTSEYYKEFSEALKGSLILKNSKKFNDDSSSYYFTGYKKTFASLSLYDKSNVHQNSSFSLTTSRKDIESFLAKTENRNSIKFNFSKTIFGKFFNNLQIDESFLKEQIDTKDVNLYSGDFLSNDLTLTLPLKNSIYSLKLTNSRYKADKEIPFDYSYDVKKISFTRLWDTLNFFDIFFHMSFEDFTPLSIEQLPGIKNDFRKKFINLSTTRYFNLNSNLTIDITTGEKSFWNQDTVYSNFHFFKKDIDLNIGNYTLSYSALDKRYDITGRDPKTVQYDIGAYYAKNW